MKANRSQVERVCFGVMGLGVALMGVSAITFLAIFATDLVIDRRGLGQDLIEFSLAGTAFSVMLTVWAITRKKQRRAKMAALD